MPPLLSEELSYANHERRLRYHEHRRKLDSLMLKYAIIDSYFNFKKSGVPYPFVDSKALEHTFSGEEAEIEHQQHNSALVVFYEDCIPESYGKNFRFNSRNEVILENFYPLLVVDNYDPSHRNMDHPQFENLLRRLLIVDSAVLIQNKDDGKYTMTNFHMKIDKNYYECTEQMAIYLRYVARNLLELSPEIKENMQSKIAQFYGFNYDRVSNRRQAAIVAASLLQTEFQYLGAVYVSSASERTLTRISESGVSKYGIIKIDNGELEAFKKQIPKTASIDDYVVDKGDDWAAVILHVVYAPTIHSVPPEDDKIRDFSARNSWIKVDKQLIIPHPDKVSAPPIRVRKLYGGSIMKSL